MSETLARLVRHILISKLGLICLVAVALLCVYFVSAHFSEQSVTESAVSTSTEKSLSDFSEGAASYERYSARVDRVNVVFEQKDYQQYRLTTNDLVREGELNTERGFEDDEDATVYVLNWRGPEGQQMRYVRLTSEPRTLYVLDSAGRIVRGGALTLEQ